MSDERMQKLERLDSEAERATKVIAAALERRVCRLGRGVAT